MGGKTAISLYAVGTLVLVGCAHCPLCGGEWGGGAVPESAAVAAPRIVEVSGSVSCPERVAVLPTYGLRVSLTRASTGEVLAQSLFSPIGSFPAFFALQYDAAATDDGEPLLLSAQLLSGDSPILGTDCDSCIRSGVAVRGTDLVLSRAPQRPAQ